MDEFSFPTIATDDNSICQFPFPHFAASPLWFVAAKETVSAGQKRRSFSTSETGVIGEYSLKKVGDGAEFCNWDLSSTARSDEGGMFVEHEEKMDMLWENFNEEIARISCSKREDVSDHDMVACVHQAMEMTRGGSIIPRRRQSLLAILKLLKKILMIQRRT